MRCGCLTHEQKCFQLSLKTGENHSTCMDYEVDGVRPRGTRQRKLGCEVMEKDCEIRQVCKEDVMDRRKSRKLIKDVV